MIQKVRTYVQSWRFFQKCAAICATAAMLSPLSANATADDMAPSGMLAVNLQNFSANTLNQFVASGIKTVRISTSWNDIEIDKNVYSTNAQGTGYLDQLTSVLQTLNSHGIAIDLLIGNTPIWATSLAGIYTPATTYPTLSPVQPSNQLVLPCNPCSQSRHNVVTTLAVGMYVVGSGITTGTIVTQLRPAGNSTVVTLSAATSIGLDGINGSSVFFSNPMISQTVAAASFSGTTATIQLQDPSEVRLGMFASYTVNGVLITGATVTNIVTSTTSGQTTTNIYLGPVAVAPAVNTAITFSSDDPETWAPASCTGNTPATCPDWSAFLVKMVQLFPYVTHWEIFNEEDQKLYWEGMYRPTAPVNNSAADAASDFANIIQTAAYTIHTNQPDSVVLLGGMAIRGFDLQGTQTASYLAGHFWDSLMSVLPVSGLSAFDVAAFHNYDQQGGALTSASYNGVVAMLTRYYGAKIPDIWITETGTYATSTNLQPVARNGVYATEARKADYLDRQLDFYSRTPYVKKVFVYEYSDGNTAALDGQDHMGLVSSDDTPIPHPALAHSSGWNGAQADYLNNQADLQALSYVKAAHGDGSYVTPVDSLGKQMSIPGGKYMYFAVNDNYIHQSNAGLDTNVVFTVQYWDGSPGDPTTHWQLQYDGIDTSVKNNSYEVAGTVTTTGSATWKQAYFAVSDAYFSNRQNNGADFRINPLRNGDNKLLVSNVVVRKQIEVEGIPTSWVGSIVLGTGSVSGLDTDAYKLMSPYFPVDRQGDQVHAPVICSGTNPSPPCRTLQKGLPLSVQVDQGLVGPEDAGLTLNITYWGACTGTLELYYDSKCGINTHYTGGACTSTPHPIVTCGKGPAQWLTTGPIPITDAQFARQMTPDLLSIVPTASTDSGNADFFLLDPTGNITIRQITLINNSR